MPATAHISSTNDHCSLGAESQDDSTTREGFQTISPDELSALLGCMDEHHSTDCSSDELCSSPPSMKAVAAGKRKRSVGGDDVVRGVERERRRAGDGARAAAQRGQRRRGALALQRGQERIRVHGHVRWRVPGERPAAQHARGGRHRLSERAAAQPRAVVRGRALHDGRPRLLPGGVGGRVHRLGQRAGAGRHFRPVRGLRGLQ
ncbi:hypothetical protein ON010_g8318 [Phytophthora cinnamomi]|nr:hypothetical protein ON010_g8318 [Phytophthora cinnamomi]